jgi:hypothetical protein
MSVMSLDYSLCVFLFFPQASDVAETRSLMPATVPS